MGDRGFGKNGPNVTSYGEGGAYICNFGRHKFKHSKNKNFIDVVIFILEIMFQSNVMKSNMFTKSVFSLKIGAM